MSKKLLSIVLTLALVFSLAACGANDKPTEAPGTTVAPAKSTEAPKTDSTPAAADTTSAISEAAQKWPEKTITWYTGPAGGTNDTMTRAIAKTLEEKLGVSVVVVNGNTTIQMDEMLKQAADGYSIGPLQLPDCFGYLNPDDSGFHPSKDFTYVCNIVSEMAAIAIHEDDARFKDVNNLGDLIAWCKANPNENILCGCGPVAATHDITIRLIIQETGVTNLKIINTEGGIANRKATFLGNSVDIYVGNVGDASLLIPEGGKVICQFGTERSDVLPDVATAVECGINVVYGGHRGVTMSADVDPDIVKKFAEAMDWVVEQQQFKDDLAATGQALDYIPYSEYPAYMAEQERIFTELLPLFGWVK